MGWFDSIVDGVKKAGNVVYDNVVKPVYDNVVLPTYDFINPFFKPVYTKIYGWATSDQAKAIYEKGKQVGISISDSFIDGANKIHSGLGDTIKEKVNEGWREAKKYTTENACNIVVGPSIASVIGLVIGTEKVMLLEEKLAFKAVSSYNPEVKDKMLVDFSKSVSLMISEPIYQIPGVPGSKNDTESIIAFCVYKSLVSDNSNTLYLKDLLSGALICGLTSYICNGSAPKGFSEWKKKNY